MYHKYLQDKSFFTMLYQIDQDLAQKTKSKGCPYCGGGLHVANYMRKPRGVETSIDSHCLCFSFSCERSGCRRREKPATVRFFGKFVFCSVWVLLISVMINGRPKRRRDLERLLGVNGKTIKRWQWWWSEFFPKTKIWKNLKGQINAKIISFPSDILRLFMQTHSLAESIKRFLRIMIEQSEQII